MPARPPVPTRFLLIEIVLYAILVSGYLWLVLLLLEGWILDLHATTTFAYAVAALGLIVGQGFVLDLVVEVLVRFVRSLLG